ncbi:hypothetical protein [Microbacterium xylanilyticum]
MSRPLEDWSYSEEFDALGLSAPERAVARYLCWRVSKKSGWWYESIDKIAAKTGLGASTVRKALDRLEVQAYLVRERRRDRRGYGMEYVFAFPALQPVDAVSWRAALRPGLPLAESARSARGDSMTYLDTPTALSERTGPLSASAPDRSERAHKRTREENEGRKRGDSTAPTASGRGRASDSQLAYFRDLYVICHRQEPSEALLASASGATHEDVHESIMRLQREAYTEYRDGEEIRHEEVRDDMQYDGSWDLLSDEGRAKLDVRAEKRIASEASLREAFEAGAPKTDADWWKTASAADLFTMKGAPE